MESDTYTITSYIAGAIHEESSSNDADEAMAEYRRMSEAEPEATVHIYDTFENRVVASRPGAKPSVAMCSLEEELLDDYEAGSFGA